MLPRATGGLLLATALFVDLRPWAKSVKPGDLVLAAALDGASELRIRQKQASRFQYIYMAIAIKFKRNRTDFTYQRLFFITVELVFEVSSPLAKVTPNARL